VLLPLEAVAEQVENSRRVLSAWVRFLSLLDCTLLMLGSVCVFTGEAFGEKDCCISKENKHDSKTIYSIVLLFFYLVCCHFYNFCQILAPSSRSRIKVPSLPSNVDLDRVTLDFKTRSEPELGPTSSLRTKKIFA
jgi:hypothetical protein